jgi:hypothetical protein
VAFATANRVLMLEHSIYSVISPEGCASILWKDSEKMREAAEALRLTAQDLSALGVIDRIVREPVGGAHRDKAATIAGVGRAVAAALDELRDKPGRELRDARRRKFLQMGTRALRPEAPILARLALALLPLAAPAGAEGLLGREVLIRVETWDDPAAPYLVSRDYVATVRPGAEFVLEPDRANGLVVAEAKVDLGSGRVDVRMMQEGRFAEAAFNGFVLSFPTDCALIEGAAIDPAATTAALSPGALTVGPQALRVNVAGLDYKLGDSLGVILDVADCPLS